MSSPHNKATHVSEAADPRTPETYWERRCAHLEILVDKLHTLMRDSSPSLFREPLDDLWDGYAAAMREMDRDHFGIEPRRAEEDDAPCPDGGKHHPQPDTEDTPATDSAPPKKSRGVH